MDEKGVVTMNAQGLPAANPKPAAAGMYMHEKKERNRDSEFSKVLHMLVCLVNS